MRVITSAEIDRVLTFPALIEALAEAFRGDMVTPVRHHHEVERPGAHGTLLLMPSWTGPAMQDGFLGVKVVTVFPENGTRSLPSVMGSYLLMDGATGEP
ncbi:MAG: ornithine cyclodeaminase, partial [Microvirga sp.]|nr:ornithine cyclodeaminase [Microvirga sp.]